MTYCGCCGRRRFVPGRGDGIYWCVRCRRHVIARDSRLPT